MLIGLWAGFPSSVRQTAQTPGFGKNNDLNTKFWSTKDPGQKPFDFQIGMGNVIKAWDEGVMSMAKVRVCFDCSHQVPLMDDWSVDITSSAGGRPMRCQQLTSNCSPPQFSLNRARRP